MPVRKALLVGINAYSGAPLRGCINDVMQMKGLLQGYYGFTDAGIRLLLNEAATFAAIQAGLKWLAQDGAESDAVRVFHYSGHGSYVADQNGDEPDGRDECLVPYDYQTAGLIVDDTLKTFYDRFPQTGNFTLVMDSCYSGSVQKDIANDVAYRFLPVSLEEQERVDAAAARFAENQQEFIVNQLLQARHQDLSDDQLRQRVHRLMSQYEKVRYGDVRVREANILLAGCRSDQQSADARIAGDYYGAFTYYLAEAITQSNGQISYRQLSEQTSKRLNATGFSQVPQLEYRAKRDQRPAFQPF